MTDEEWKAIAKAWSAWVCGEGPPVQFMRDGRWIDKLDACGIHSSHSHQWRIKPEQLRVRTFRFSDGTYETIEVRGDSQRTLSGDVTWSSPWMEIPE